MIGATLFLSVHDVLSIHDHTIEHQGGAHGIRDLGLLDAAVGMPRQSFAEHYLHDGLHAMAAAYLFHLCRNHPFVDGNKRTALAASLVFLQVNGVESLPDPAQAERVTLDVASGTLGKEALIEWFHDVLQ